MIQSFRNKSYYRYTIWLIVAACFISIYLLISEKDSIFIIAGDTVNYWAAGKLMLSGENPYQMEKVLEFQQSIGKFEVFPDSPISMILYPPWMLPLTIPLGLLNYPTSRVTWLFVNILCILISVRYIWFLYSGNTKREIIPYLIMATFPPTIFLLGSGHITSLLLLGVVLFLFFIRRSTNTNLSQLIAGVFASIALFKPQILYLFLIALLIWILSNRAWWVLLGGLITLSGFSLISMIFDPGIINHYWNAMSSYPLGTWATPTLGLFLRGLFGYEYDWLQLLPPILGIIWLIFRWHDQNKKWDWLEEIPLLLLVCVVTSPYIWTYDMIVLLIPIIALFSVISNRRFRMNMLIVIVCYAVIILLNLLFHFKYSDHWFVWFAPAILVWYLIGYRVISGNQPENFMNGEVNP